MTRADACERCLARSWLLARLSGHLDHSRARLYEALALSNEELIAALGGRQRDAIRGELEGFDAEAARVRSRSARIAQLCRCQPAYPPQLAELRGAPAALHLSVEAPRFIGLLGDHTVAIVGARRASAYGVESAAALARGLASAGITVISGMAFGVDSAAHAAALDAGGPTVAVLPGGPDRPYPRAKRPLAQRIAQEGALVSELPPGTAVRRWMFPARNRIIAALATMTIVVEASELSGAMITATVAGALGRKLGAVPGRISSRLADGPHRLIAAGATLVRSPEDVLDELFGVGSGPRPSREARPDLAPECEATLAAIRDGADTAAALARRGLTAVQVLEAVGQLELGGYVRRGEGGRLTPIV